MSTEIRWKQQYRRFDSAFVRLQSALSDGPGALNRLEADGVVRRFNSALELAWRTLKEFLEDRGVQFAMITPRHVLKAALDAQVLTHGAVWLEMFHQRNLRWHAYDEAHFQAAFRAIAERYLPVMEELHRTLTLAFEREAEDP